MTNSEQQLTDLLFSVTALQGSLSSCPETVRRFVSVNMKLADDVSLDEVERQLRLIRCSLVCALDALADARTKNDG